MTLMIRSRALQSLLVDTLSDLLHLPDSATSTSHQGTLGASTLEGYPSRRPFEG